MKLIKLTLENIGPYNGKYVIDFNKLNNSLFLITGPTGSGKSYIFDSICYALYSKTSGGNRETDDLKSKYAKLDDTASVELEFEYHNNQYKIRREPRQYKRMKRRNALGLDSKEYLESSILTMPDGSVIEKGVTAKIVEIIGLDYSQFKMTMMIAQGDFYSLINANTRDREAIFRKILNTEKLNNFTEKLKELMQQKEKEVSSINTSINTILSRFAFDNETNTIITNPDGLLSTKLPLIKSKLDLSESDLRIEKDNLNSLEENMLNSNNNYTKALLNNDNYNTYQKEKKNNGELLSAKPLFDSKKNKYELALKANKVLLINNDYEKELERNKKLRDNLDLLAKEIKDLNDSKESLAPRIEKKEELSKSNERLAIKINELESNINEIDKYNKLRSDKENHNNNIKKLNADENLILESIDKLKNEILKYRNIASGDIKYEELEKVNTEINKITLDIDNLKNKKSNIYSYLEDMSKYKRLSDEYENKLNEFNIANDNYNHYEKAFFDSIAGIIAKDLKEGEPCPVCGNVHHVKKAVLKEELSEAKKKELKEIADSLSLEVNKIKNKCGSLSTAINKTREYISEFIKSDFNENNVLSLYNNLIEKMNLDMVPLKKRQSELIEENKKVESAKSMVDKLSMELEDEKSKLDEIRQSISSMEKELAGIDSRLEDMRKFEGADKKTIESQIDSYKNEKKENEEFIKKVDSSSAEIERQLASKKSLSEHNKNELEKSNNEISNKKSKLNDSLKDNGFEDGDKAKLNALSEKDIDALNKEINEFDYKLKSSNDKLADYKEKKYDELVYQDLSILEEEKNKASNIYNEANDKYSNNNSIYSNNMQSYKDLLKLNEENSKSLSRYKEIESLYNVASGNVPGNRVNFEVYYQLQIFDEILKVASFKFNTMTDGRYEMIRGLPKGGNAQIGLEIDVRDLYNGEVRPVSGLSGGESFQASMSLALAFSEIIQLKAGGVELNSMFIDEGFGTLDNEMLNNTKKTLLEIGESTNRRIGIISHIAELEKSIPSKIVVKKTSSGSSFNIVNE